MHQYLILNQNFKTNYFKIYKRFFYLQIIINNYCLKYMYLNNFFIKYSFINFIIFYVIFLINIFLRNSIT